MTSRSCNLRVTSSNNTDLKAMLLTQSVILVTCLSSFVAGRQLAPEPSASSPSASSSSSSLCSRALATTLWGAAFAFFSLMADAWPASKTFTSLTGDTSLVKRLKYLLLFSPVCPLFGFLKFFQQIGTNARFRAILRRLTNPELRPYTMFKSHTLMLIQDFKVDLLSILFDGTGRRCFFESTRIVANTYIVLGVCDSTTLPFTHIDRDHSPVNEDNMADALTLGHKTAGNSRLMELNQAGKLALLETSILPNYKQLRFLDGRSPITTHIIGVQATGFVTSIVYRAILHLPVSPVEAISFAFGLLVIVRSITNVMGAVCQNPLVIYLNPTQEQEMLDKCESTRWSDLEEGCCEDAAILGMLTMGSLVVAFTVLVEWHVLRISWLDAIGPILFLLSLILQLFLNVLYMKHSYPSTWTYWIFFPSMMISFGGVVLSIVATILNWQTNKFDSRTPSVIHYLPFLG